MVIYHTSCPFTIQATRRRKKADVHTSARARQSEYPMRATGASAASLDIQPDTSGETSISEYKKTLKPDINSEHVLHTFKIIPRMSLVPDSRSVPRRQPVPVSLRLTLDPTHPVT